MASSKNTSPNPGILVPMEQLSDQAIHGLINEFILREGTDYGVREYSLLEKHQQILKQMKAGHVQVVFDMTEQSCSLMRKESLPQGQDYFQATESNEDFETNP